MSLSLQKVFQKKEEPKGYKTVMTSTFTGDNVEDYLFDTYSVFLMAYTMRAHEAKDGSYNIQIYDYYDDGTIYKEKEVHNKISFEQALDVLENFETKCVEKSIEPENRRSFEKKTRERNKDNPYHIRTIRPVAGSRAFSVPVVFKK